MARDQARARDRWNVLPHGRIEKLAENLWRVEGTLPMMSLKRVMTIARRADGGLVIHSAVALDEPAMSELEGWGKPAFLIVPNRYHRLDAPAFKKRYPALRVLTPKGSRAKVEDVVACDGTCDDYPDGDGVVRFQMLRGVGDVEAVMVVRSPDGVSLVFCDAFFNMDRKRDPLGFFFTTLLGSAPGPRVGRLFKTFVVKDKAALRGDLERLAETPDLVRVIVAHEKVASGRDAAAATLRRAATSL
jgi:hypothetical protein